MAAAGAILGPVLGILVIPIACVLGLGWAAFRWATHRHAILPFGPWLAIGSILALFVGHPFIHWYVKHML
jgi:prepilin signal peptidase PulO-like enzyme (type II secretory pathway)